MKKLSTLITAVFMIMAAILGWCLPIADFNIYDQINDGKQMDLEIQQINLSYRDDLTMQQKINIANYDNDFAGAVELDRGIYVQKEGLELIVEDFLADFTGYRLDVSKDWYAVPMLVNLSNNRGTIVVWNVQILLDEYWECQLFIDDRTGAILRCSFHVDPDYWENLVLGYNDANDPYSYISDRFRTAIYNHYASRIDAKIVTFHMIGDTFNDEAVAYLFVFKDDKNYTFECTVTISIPYGWIEPY
ncbi:MAG: hypothetical protein IKG03_06980 [Clostridiales bacterium]|nr:hypothetical protein [Clostridiales bacterium]